MKMCTRCGRQNQDDCPFCPECGAIPRVRTASPAELLGRVVDRASFIEFVAALSEERAEAEVMEKDEPARYQLGGAHDWQNGTISEFLYSGLAYFSSSALRKPEDMPSWKMFADFLYYGKVYE